MSRVSQEAMDTANKILKECDKVVGHQVPLRTYVVSRLVQHAMDAVTPKKIAKPDHFQSADVIAGVIIDYVHAEADSKTWIDCVTRVEIEQMVLHAINAAIQKLNQPSNYLGSCAFSGDDGCEKGMADCDGW